MADDLIKVAERPIKPGPHAVTVQHRVRPGKKGDKEQRELGYESEHTFVVNVPDGKTHDRRRSPATTTATCPNTSPRSRWSSRARNDRAARSPCWPSRRGRCAARRPTCDPVGHYLADLEKAGALARRTSSRATLDRLRTSWRGAEDDLVTGNAAGRQHRLFRMVESPRYAQFQYAPEYENAELTLARALVRAGAYKSAERYLVRVLGRGASTPFFAPAYRAMVDIALETREEAAILAVPRSRAAAGPRCRATAPNEHAYLAGKVAYEAGDWRPRGASSSAGRPPVALLRAGAVLPRPDSGARAAHFAGAHATCARSSSRPTRTASRSSSTAATAPSRTWPTWRWGASRTSRASTTTPTTSTSACPTDSERLPDALFEASWSMFQKGEYEAARAFIEQFDHDVPTIAAGARRAAAARDDRSQVVPVRSGAARRWTTFVKTYAPIQARGRGADRGTRRGGARCTAAC